VRKSHGDASTGAKGNERPPRPRPWKRLPLLLTHERRNTAGLASFLAALGIVSGVLGWRLYVEGSQAREGSGFFNGLAAVYLSASEPPTSKSYVLVQAKPSQSVRGGDQTALTFSIRMSAADYPLTRPRWALALTGDAALHPSATQSGFGTVARTADDRPHDELGADVSLVYATAADRSLITGDFRYRPGSSPAEIWANVTLPLSKPFLLDSGATYALSTPEFGVWEDRSVSQTGEIRAAAPRGLSEGQLARLQGPNRWSLPDEQAFTFSDRDRGGFQDFGTEPTRTDVRTWSSLPSAGNPRQFLKVDAMFTRPEEQERQGRQLFLAGLLLSASVSLLIWATEHVLGPERSPLRRRPRKPA
jgi:hypothetical protein